MMFGSYRELIKARNTAVIRLRYPSYVIDNIGRAAVFPKLGLVYGRVKKSANTSIVAWLADLEGINYNSPSEMKRTVMSPKTLNLWTNLRLDRFYSFTFVRDPYSRVLSAFLDKVAPAKRLYTDIPGNGQANASGFEAFLRYLDSGGLYDNEHWWPQVDLLYKPVEEFSFVGRVENIAEHMEVVLAKARLKSGARLDFDSPHRIKSRKTSATGKVDAFYSEAARDIVQRLYRRDFEKFGYSMSFTTLSKS